MTRDYPHFVDGGLPNVSDPPEQDPSGTAEQPTTVMMSPVLLEPAHGAPHAIGADWNPARRTPCESGHRSSAYAVAGFGLILGTWFLLSLLGSLIGFFKISAGLGVVAAVLSLSGGAFLVLAIAHEWRSLRALHRVDALRAAWVASADVESTRNLARTWLEGLGERVPEAALVSAALRDAADREQIHALLRCRLTEPLSAATREIGIRAAADVGALVAISPHESWDALIVALRGMKVIRQVAQLYGLRPGAAVTMALVGRVSRAAVETAVVDLVSQTAADHLLKNLPFIKHLSGILGASTAAFRLYRLSAAAGRACSPLAS